jgi:hypothetical protein
MAPQLIYAVYERVVKQSIKEWQKPQKHSYYQVKCEILLVQQLILQNCPTSNENLVPPVDSAPI